MLFPCFLQSVLILPLFFYRSEGYTIPLLLLGLTSIGLSLDLIGPQCRLPRRKNAYDNLSVAYLLPAVVLLNRLDLLPIVIWGSYLLAFHDAIDRLTHPFTLWKIVQWELTHLFVECTLIAAFLPYAQYLVPLVVAYTFLDLFLRRSFSAGELVVISHGIAALCMTAFRIAVASNIEIPPEDNVWLAVVSGLVVGVLAILLGQCFLLVAKVAVDARFEGMYLNSTLWGNQHAIHAAAIIRLKQQLGLKRKQLNSEYHRLQPPDDDAKTTSRQLRLEPERTPPYSSTREAIIVSAAATFGICVAIVVGMCFYQRFSPIQKDVFRWFFEDFVDATPQRYYAIRICGLFTSVGLVLAFASGFGNNAVTKNQRKWFHLLAVVMFTPAIYLDVELVALAGAGLLPVFMVVEFMRYHCIYPVGDFIHNLFSKFSDSLDSGPAILTHSCLLLGCVGPIWLQRLLFHTNFGFGPWAGIISIGVGDSMASIVGSKVQSEKLIQIEFDAHQRQWVFLLSQKSIAGCLANCISQFAVYLLLNTVFGLGGGYLTGLFACVCNAWFEATTDQIDNLILPFIAFGLFTIV